MAGEAYLLSGDQIATYASVSAAYPGGVPHITLNGLQTLGDADSRFFVVRLQGSGEQVTNSQVFAVYPAVDDGSGTLAPGPTPVVGSNYATPDAYENTGAGDDYLIFGLFGGTRFAIDINGFNDATSYTVIRGQDIGGGDQDGEFDLADLAAANPDAVICFAGGTPIDTPSGPVPVERLRVGDLVNTLDHGPRPIRWIGSARVALSGLNRRLAPVRIGAGALGPGLPARDVTVSPAHRVLVADYHAQLLLGEDEVLIPAKALVNGQTVLRLTDLREVTYWHLMFDRHEIIGSAGLLSESFHPGSYAVTTLDREAREELFGLFPELAAHGWEAYGKTARSIARGFEARLIAAPERRSSSS